MSTDKKPFEGCPLFESCDTLNPETVDELIMGLRSYVRGLVHGCPHRKDYRTILERVRREHSDILPLIEAHNDGKESLYQTAVRILPKSTNNSAFPKGEK